MKLLTLSKDALDRASNLSWGSVDDKIAVVGDAVRLELLARQFTLRRLLIERVVRTLQPVISVEAKTVTAVVEEMARIGEITRADRGILAAAPLRAVRLGDDQYRFFGGGSTKQLEALLSVEMQISGCAREVRLSSQSEDFEATVASLGGVVLTLDKWSGVERILPPGSEWLEQLDEELSYNATLPATFIASEGEWRGYRPEQGVTRQVGRWRRQDENSVERLWRKRHESGYWVYAWTTGGPPADLGVLKLGVDDALRTGFALDRLTDAPLDVSYERNGGQVEFIFDGMFPRAEYRFLVTIGERVIADGIPCYRVSAERWAYTSTFLGERLGVRVAEGI